MDQSPNTMKRWALIGGAVAVVLILIATLTTSRGQAQGTVTVVHNLTDSTGITIKYNNTKAKATQKLTPGKYTVTIEKNGFTKFSTDFTLQANEQLLINARLKPVDVPEISTIEELPLPDPMPGATITHVEYFHDHTWAVVFAAFEDEQDAIVVHYDSDSRAWYTVDGPAVTFMERDIIDFPVLVQDYLKDNNFVGSED